MLTLRGEHGGLEMKVADAIAHHQGTPHVSVEDYVRRKRIDLARAMEPSRKVYLDTKFWLLLRDARLGRSCEAGVVALLELLQTLVAHGRVVCPISATTFAEIFAQTDPTTLQVSVELIDELSAGVTFIEEHERFRLEFFHFIMQKTRGPNAVLPLQTLAWTKLAYVLGFMAPVSKSYPADVDLVLQKEFVDHMWTVSLGDMLRVMGTAAVGRFPRAFDDTSTSLNEGKFANLHEHNSFKQVFQSEIAGILDVFKPDLADLMRHVYELQFGRPPDVSDGSDDGGRMFANLIYHAFRLNKLTAELPSLRVSAGLHAALRWDKNRKYKRNDLHDFHHAVAAIPYCDYFLTEHSLRQLLGHNGLRFAELFPCQTISSVADSLASLSQLTP